MWTTFEIGGQIFSERTLAGAADSAIAVARRWHREGRVSEARALHEAALARKQQARSTGRATGRANSIGRVAWARPGA